DRRAHEEARLRGTGARESEALRTGDAAHAPAPRTGGPVVDPDANSFHADAERRQRLKCGARLERDARGDDPTSRDRVLQRAIGGVRLDLRGDAVRVLAPHEDVYDAPVALALCDDLELRPTRVPLGPFGPLGDAPREDRAERPRDVWHDPSHRVQR